ncbi:hypothetical protein ABHA39_04140 [Clostridium paraputrificum]|uniref:hypothetical protein n=1 Tax=Clostridium paraputrificum TaxID=29363 RepID=UPI00232BC623|nr:hypothetical protein [Clostridium paraputrificum]MDB2071405.1 hypothetical protein [Clostridium paraputrificum]MDB2081682.1 hypothetical protein [Clostridium paraputrificum]
MSNKINITFKDFELKVLERLAKEDNSLIDNYIETLVKNHIKENLNDNEKLFIEKSNKSKLKQHLFTR